MGRQLPTKAPRSGRNSFSLLTGTHKFVGRMVQFNDNRNTTSIVDMQLKATALSLWEKKYGWWTFTTGKAPKYD